MSDFHDMADMMAESSDDQDMTLRIWDGDESVLGELVMRHYGVIKRIIQKRYPRLTFEDAEDVVSLAIERFWRSRDKYDGTRPLIFWLLGIAKNVAMETVACRLKWQKARQLEVRFDSPIESFSAKKLEDKLDSVETKNPKLLPDFQRVVANLPPIECDIFHAYAFSGDMPPDASELGIELGKKYKNGTPIPAGTIRVYKSRAISFVKSEMKKLGYDLDRLERQS